MSSADPNFHRQAERQFMEHVRRLLNDDRLRLDTTRGRRPVTGLIVDSKAADRAVDLRRTLAEMNRPDRELESHLPIGMSMEVVLSRRSFWLFKNTVGRLRVVCQSPTRALIGGESGKPMSASDVTRLMAETPPPLGGVPMTVVICSTSGFTQDARELAERGKDRTVILAAPNDAGGWTITGPTTTKALSDLFDPEADAAKRERIRREIESARVELLSGGIASDRLAVRANVPAQFVEDELKSYAKENAGLAAKRIDGRVVLFQQGAASAGAGGLDMPFIDRMKSLFAGKGEVEKKIALLSERRAALTQQRDRSYDDLGAMENKELQLRQEFKDAAGDLSRRRITSQLVQLRKDLERRQQLLSMLNQQINVLGTQLLNLELLQQGKSAKLPTSDEMADTAAQAEEVLAELQANTELADSVSESAPTGMSSEEQAMYDELMGAKKEEPAKTSPAVEKSAPAAQKLPPIPQRKPAEPEAG